jgi:hypothetical protein
MEFESWGMLDKLDENGDFVEVDCTVVIHSYSNGAKATYWQPEEYPEIEFDVYANGECITDKVTPETLERIQEYCWEWINET